MSTVQGSTVQFSYFDQIPAEVPKTALQSGVVSFAFGLLLSGGKWAHAAWSGACGAVATLIDAAIRPLLNYLFAPEKRDGYAYWITKIIIVLAVMTLATGLIAPLLGLSSQFNFFTLPLKIVWYILFEWASDLCGWPRASHIEAQLYTM